ncbi:unnamed protein product [Cuscuta campestris]|uniref:Retrotransposon Copia-like N-terminal domain-containing protein n=1 Tax=Cuscuta campestris TaxID=132261 RepID=A0A484LN80_9ASTE|nr:unnamed protein product [Cuscuta campestris]
MSSEKSPSSSKPTATTPHLAFTMVSNVKLQVPITLSYSEPNYKKWSLLFLLLVQRFNIEGFITDERLSAGKDDIKWLQLDALIQGWILSTINDEVSDLILSSATSAADLWKATHDLFHDNKAARAMQLEHQFYITVKGTSTISTYCQTLINIADWLDDVDTPVTENQLSLQTLRGLSDDLGKQASFLQFQKPPPTFLETRSALLLLENQRRPLVPTGDGGMALAVITHGRGAGRALAVSADSRSGNPAVVACSRAASAEEDRRQVVAKGDRRAGVVAVGTTAELLGNLLGKPGRHLSTTQTQAFQLPKGYWAHGPMLSPTRPKPF